ncbi:MAG: cytochrome c [Opitutaceae bacterium]|nr:cytochrome c [Opitutaceae bacterium]
MKTSLLATAACAALWLGSQAFGQGLQVDIPFEFSAGRKVLPAGTYAFALTPNGSSLIVSRERKEKAKLPLVTRLAHTSPFDDSRLVFDQVDGRNRLAEVWMDGDDGALVLATGAGHKHVVLEVVDPSIGKLTGKGAFEATCFRCHGAGGNGDRLADEYFKKPLPRLTSAYVQGKTDAELKEIITTGHGEMDPARIGTGRKKQLLPETAVDAVIAYLRTLEKP